MAVITPYLVSDTEAALGPKVFFMWGSLCCLSVTFAYFLVPELKGLSLEQADGKHNPLYSLVNPRTIHESKY